MKTKKLVKACKKVPLSIEKLITRKMAFGEKEALVLDDIFKKNELEGLYEVIRTMPYEWRNSDEAKNDYSTRWASFISTKEALKHTQLRRIIDLVYAIYPDLELKLERVYVNFNLYGEIHFPHFDDGRLTALFYVNKEWESEWQGETFFYENEEPVQVVAPKPNRLLLFDASILHRGSPPSRECYEPRLNIAFKFSSGHSQVKKVKKSNAGKEKIEVVRKKAA